jgi:hypothetical protein
MSKTPPLPRTETARKHDDGSVWILDGGEPPLPAAGKNTVKATVCNAGSEFAAAQGDPKMSH